MQNIKKYFMTLALLLTAVTGAWAADGVIMKELTVPSEWKNDKTSLTVDDLPGFKDCSSLTEDEAKALINSVPTGKYDIIYGVGASSNSFKVVDYDGTNVLVADIPITHGDLFGLKDICKFYYTASDAITVAWNPSDKTGSFQMPGSDVVLTPLYAPAAKWDVENAGSAEEKVLLPAALEGIIAGQDEAIVTPGQSAQGTVMYAVTTTADAAPALTAFSATVPTAKDVADDGATLYVWYYIQGHDTPDGQQATEENTFNDSEICATPLKVDVLTNKFDLTLSPAPVKNMTVTVAGQAKTPTDEGKVEAVKMQSEVKLKAATGYKFRKVEVKKGAAAGPPEYYDKLTKINDNFMDQVSKLKGLGRGYETYNPSLTAAQAYALATYQAAIDGKPVYVIMSSRDDGYEIHYALSTDAAATEHTADLYNICNESNPVRMYYVAQ